MRSHARVVVIGGGINGVGARYHLAEKGWSDVTLVDLRPRVKPCRGCRSSP